MKTSFAPLFRAIGASWHSQGLPLTGQSVVYIEVCCFSIRPWIHSQNMQLFVQSEGGSDIFNIVSAAVALKKNSGLKRTDELEGNRSSYGIGGDVNSCNSTITRYARDGKIADARHVFEKMLERNVVSWNAMIAGYGRNGCVEDARKLFDRMPERNVVSWNSMIRAYARTGRIRDAHQLFDKMPERNVISWTSVIAGYTRSGSVDFARQLFDEMPERDVVSWNSMINGYAENGRIEDARLLFDEMPERDVVSWNLMITRYAKSGRMKDAHQLFGKMPERDVVSWNAMIAGYVSNGSIEEARELFDKMPNRNVISWTAMIAGCAQGGNIEDARHLFDNMPQRNVISWNAMIAGYAQNGRIDDAQELFDKMPERNTISWNTMIAGYVQNDRSEDARRLFDEMPRRNAFSWTTMITGYAQDGKLEDARYLFDKMRERDVVSWTAMIAGYAQNGRIEDAHQLFDQMPERDVISWNAIIAGYSQNGYGQEALGLFSQMQQTNIKPNQSTFSSILSACAALATLEQGKRAHQQIIKMKFDEHVLLGNALITMYSKCGSIHDACQIFNKMPHCNVVSWNAMIAGYAQHGYGKEALQLFEQMQQGGTKPDHITFLSILSACSHAGLVDEGCCYFHSMSRDHCIVPMAEHYACMVDLLGRCGHLDEAEDFIKKMPFKPDAIVWGALLGACRIHVNPDLGEHVAEHLIDSEPQNASTYVLLSNIYAAAGRWADVTRLRTRMKDNQVIKYPGYSWIEVKNEVHAFLVGDRSHPQAEKIYEMLESLCMQMKEHGYVPDVNFVLRDVEEEQKKQILCYHSEKLAIAFGLMNTLPGTPVRIVKNLRVCGDCHTASKFISKIVSREIIVRDSSRFHHFKDGLCSCGDYW